MSTVLGLNLFCLQTKQRHRT